MPAPAGPSLAYLSDLDRSILLSEERTERAGYLGAKARAEELGCTLDLLCYGDPRVSLDSLHRMIAHRGIQGLVIAPHTTPQIELNLDWNDFAIVCPGFSIRSPRFDRVGFNHYEALLDVCGMAWEKGYRRIALAMTADSDARVMHLARAAFLRWQSDAQASPLPVHILTPKDPAAVNAWYRGCSPDCIIFYGRVQLLRDAGVPVGGEVAVTTPLLSAQQREFGGFNIQLRDLTATSVDMLLAKLARNERGIPSMRQTLLIQAPWVDGPAAFKPPVGKRSGQGNMLVDIPPQESSQGAWATNR
jgi:DNA-binding LacI/PurR family transcriptional regulator